MGLALKNVKPSFLFSTEPKGSRSSQVKRCSWKNQQVLKK